VTRTLLVVLVTLGDPAQLSGGYLFHRRLAERAPAYDARLEFVSMPRLTFPVAMTHAARVAREVDRVAPDVVVVDSIATAFMAFQPTRQPAVGMLHQPPGGIDHGPARTAIQAKLDRLAYRHLRRLLVASVALADDLRAQGEPAERVSVVPPGRDVAPSIDLPPGQADLRAGRRAAFLSVGNWVARKGILSLLEAFARLDPDAGTLHLVGGLAAEPSYARRIWARVAQPDLRSRVVIHGAVSTTEVAALYRSADAFVLPSLKEPYGTVYGEAMTFGLPVVGWRAGNLPNLAEDEREGLIVEPGDIDGLARTLARLANDPVLRRRLGAAAQLRALQRPTWDQVAGLFFDHLRQVARD
jgi:glycosyltransferase involved in cell wall biosynthesis